MRLAAVLFLAAAALAGCKKKESAAPPAASEQGAPAASGDTDRDVPERNVPRGPLAGKRVAPSPEERNVPVDRDDRRKQRREEFDTDGDGQLSDDEREIMRESRRAERDARRQEMVEKFDQDGDGQLSDAERAPIRVERAQRMVERVDADGDGKVTEAELAEGRGRRNRGIDFAVADTDHDGALSAEELAAAMPDRGPGGGRRGDRDRDLDDGSPPPPAP